MSESPSNQPPIVPVDQRDKALMAIELTRLRAENATHRANLAHADEKIAELQEFIRGNQLADAADIITERNTLRAEVERLTRERDEAKRQYAEALIRPDELVEECDRIEAKFLSMDMHNAELQNKISGMEDILKNVRCMCGRPYSAHQGPLKFCPEKDDGEVQACFVYNDIDPSAEYLDAFSISAILRYHNACAGKFADDLNQSRRGGELCRELEAKFEEARAALRKPAITSLSA